MICGVDFCLQVVDKTITRRADLEVIVPTIEYVVVADHAEAINGKLYLSGAGWTDLRQPPGPDGRPGYVHMGVAVSILVGWNETNRRFPLLVTIEHEDGAELSRVEGQIEAGRPPGVTEGADFRSVLAIAVEIQFPRPGGYRVRAQLGEHDERIVSFRVHHPPAAHGQAGPQRS